LTQSYFPEIPEKGQKLQTRDKIPKSDTLVDAFRVDSRNSSHCYAIILRDITASIRWLEPWR